MSKPLKVATAIFVCTFGIITTRDLMLRKPCAYQHTCTYMVICTEACPIVLLSKVSSWPSPYL